MDAGRQALRLISCHQACFFGIMDGMAKAAVTIIMDIAKKAIIGVSPLLEPIKPEKRSGRCAFGHRGGDGRFASREFHIEQFPTVT